MNNGRRPTQLPIVYAALSGVRANSPQNDNSRPIGRLLKLFRIPFDQGLDLQPDAGLLGPTL
jgi:hypothetical protein